MIFLWVDNRKLFEESGAHSYPQTAWASIPTIKSPPLSLSLICLGLSVTIFLFFTAQNTLWSMALAETSEDLCLLQPEPIAVCKLIEYKN